MQCTEINSEQKHKESRIDPVSSVCLVWQQYRDKQRSKERICWDNILQLQRWNFSIRTLEGSNIQHRSYSFSVLNTHEVYSLVSYTLSINVLISPKKSWNHFYYLILLLEKYMSVMLKYTWKINCFASESSNSSSSSCSDDTSLFSSLSGEQNMKYFRTSSSNLPPGQRALAWRRCAHFGREDKWFKRSDKLHMFHL